MKRTFRYLTSVGAMLALPLWIAAPTPANADGDQYRGFTPLNEIYEKLGVSHHGTGRHGCPGPEAFTRLLELEVNDVEETASLPAFTQVKGKLFPEIKFELRLPPTEDEWNGKFYMAGCGGFCGGVDTGFPNEQFTNNLNWGLLRGYAAVTTDSGHDNMGNGRTYADWALDNRPAERDWGYRSVHEVARVSKALACAYYGQRPEYSYFAGCSTGGRMAIMEALRFPKDFDGVISGSPALDYTGLVATWMSWVVQAVGNNTFTAANQDAIRQAVLDQCDGEDGEADGLISDPRLCPEIDSSGIGLSDSQLAALEQLHSKPTNSAGDILYEGVLPYGSEIYWPIWLPGADATAANPLALQLIGPFNDGFLKYMAFKEDDPTFTAFDFDFDTDPKALKFMGRIYNATSANLKRFRNFGGKVLMYHGWADTIVPPIYSQYYYDQVAVKMGGAEKVQKFFRLFMVPGMDHCSTAQGLKYAGLDTTSIGLDNFDALSALEKWVEEGEAPESMAASNEDGSIMQTLYPYEPVELPGKGRGRHKGKGKNK